MRFVEPTYDSDGDCHHSDFMKAVDFDEFEPMCIEYVVAAAPLPLPELVRGASYADQWGKNLDSTKSAKEAILVFSPNVLNSPSRAKTEYHGAYDYDEDD